MIYVVKSFDEDLRGAVDVDKYFDEAKNVAEEPNRDGVRRRVSRTEGRHAAKGAYGGVLNAIPFFSTADICPAPHLLSTSPSSMSGSASEPQMCNV